MERVVVVGASLAGLRAVESLRSAGHEGAITLVGAEPHLPYDRPPLSKEVLTGDWSRERLDLRPEEKWADLDVDLLLGTPATALDLDGRVVAVDGDRIPFDGLIVATGAAPREIPGARTLRTLDDSLALRAAFDEGARVCVIGAGFIGAEVAASARTRGLDVTLLEALPVPLARGLGEEMGMACAELHRDAGVDLRLGVAVDAVEPGGVRLADGTLVEADVVVAGIGVSPVTGWLEGSGLELRDGVVCDETLAAAGADGVYAAGDLCRWAHPTMGEIRIEHWTNATEQGDAAARNLLRRARGEAAEPFAPVPYFWSDQYDTKIQFVGRCAPDDEVRVVAGSVQERKFVAAYGRAGRLVACLGFSMPRKVMQFRRLLAESASWEDALALAENN